MKPFRAVVLCEGPLDDAARAWVDANGGKVEHQLAARYALRLDHGPPQLVMEAAELGEPLQDLAYQAFRAATGQRPPLTAFWLSADRLPIALRLPVSFRRGPDPHNGTLIVGPGRRVADLPGHDDRWLSITWLTQATPAHGSAVAAHGRFPVASELFVAPPMVRLEAEAVVAALVANEGRIPQSTAVVVPGPEEWGDSDAYHSADGRARREAALRWLAAPWSRPPLALVQLRALLAAEPHVGHLARVRRIGRPVEGPDIHPVPSRLELGIGPGVDPGADLRRCWLLAGTAAGDALEVRTGAAFRHDLVEALTGCQVDLVDLRATLPESTREDPEPRWQPDRVDWEKLERVGRALETDAGWFAQRVVDPNRQLLGRGEWKYDNSGAMACFLDSFARNLVHPTEVGTGWGHALWRLVDCALGDELADLDALVAVPRAWGRTGARLTRDATGREALEHAPGDDPQWLAGWAWLLPAGTEIRLRGDLLDDSYSRMDDGTLCLAEAFVQDNLLFNPLPHTPWYTVDAHNLELISLWQAGLAAPIAHGVHSLPLASLRAGRGQLLLSQLRGRTPGGHPIWIGGHPWGHAALPCAVHDGVVDLAVVWGGGDRRQRLTLVAEEVEATDPPPALAPDRLYLGRFSVDSTHVALESRPLCARLDAVREADPRYPWAESWLRWTEPLWSVLVGLREVTRSAPSSVAGVLEHTMERFAELEWPQLDRLLIGLRRRLDLEKGCSPRLPPIAGEWAPLHAGGEDQVMSLLAHQGWTVPKRTGLRWALGTGAWVFEGRWEGRALEIELLRDDGLPLGRLALRCPVEPSPIEILPHQLVAERATPVDGGWRTVFPPAVRGMLARAGDRIRIVGLPHLPESQLVFEMC